MKPSLSPSIRRLLSTSLASLAAVLSVQFLLGARFLEPNATAGERPKATHDELRLARATTRQFFSQLPPNTTYDICVVGAGLSGTVLAERYAKLLGKRSLVIESREHIGGNCFDFVDEESDILMNKYGAHLFHTNNERVWRYIKSWQHSARWVKWEHKVKGWIQGKLLPIPVNVDTVNALFNLSLTPTEMRRWLESVQIPCTKPDQNNNAAPQDEFSASSSSSSLSAAAAAASPAAASPSSSAAAASASAPPATAAAASSSSSSSSLSSAEDLCRNAEEMATSRVGTQLYQWVFKRYTEKQWGRDPRELDASITARIPVRQSRDSRYFSDKYQVLPLHGYTRWFEAMLDHPLIDVLLGVDYFDIREQLQNRCGKTFFTGPIDRYFAEAGLGKLEYRSIRFEKEVIRNIGPGYYQTNSVVNYPGPEVNFTRIVEYKHFLRQRSNHTVIVKEFSTDDGDPYYPVLNQRNRELHSKFQLLAEREEKRRNVHFVGRLANFKYFDMDAAIANALSVFERCEKIDSLADLTTS